MLVEYLSAVFSSPTGAIIGLIVGFIIFYGLVFIGVTIYRWIEFLITGVM